MKIQVTELPNFGFWLLRSAPNDIALTQWLEQEFALKLPIYGRIAIGKDALVWQTRRDAWMLMVSSKQDIQASVIAVDLRSAYRVLEFQGKQVRTLLNRGCPLDLGDDRFQPHSQARSWWVQIPVEGGRMTTERWLIAVA